MAWYRTLKAKQKHAVYQTPKMGQSLLSLRPQIAAAAQEVYNHWEQDVDGIDITLGSGGICDQVLEAMGGVVNSIPGVDVTDGGQDGDDHAYLVAYSQTEAYGVDIPPGVYETGGGYNWKKIPDVVIDASDVIIFPLNRADYEF